MYSFDFMPKSYDDRIMEGDYSKVSEISSEHIGKIEDGKIFLKYTTPQIELGGINDPRENGGEFYRLDVTKKELYKKELFQEGIHSLLATHTSGATLRFRTNASELALYAIMRNPMTEFHHFTDRGAFGLDLYVGSGSARVYCGGRMQMLTKSKKSDVMADIVKLPGGYCEVLINMPLYSGINEILIGFPEDSELARPLERDIPPIVFYGSSITQGACASRPGIAYPNLVCRMLNAQCINQGYSSGAHLEPIMAEYVASYHGVSAFVIDNDGNGTAENHRLKHYNFYKTIRNANPDTPILLLTRPIYHTLCPDVDIERISIIKDTYERALSENDKNVYFLSGYEFFPEKAIADVYSVDMTHPNDIGMYYMAMAVYKKLREILKI